MDRNQFLMFSVDLLPHTGQIIRMSSTRSIPLIVTLLLSIVSCGDSRVQPPAFDADRAFGYLERQVEFGPRVPGSAASAQCRDYIYRHLADLGPVVDSQAFDYLDPYSGQNIRMVNVVASFAGESSGESERIVLMAHYDCRPRTDFASDPALFDSAIDGANDGASGTAVLMELANLFEEVPPPGGVDLVLVDGEDWGKPGDHENYLLGSREFARRGIHDKYRFGIVIDLVGDADQDIYREAYSERFNRELNDLVFNEAQRLGITTFHDTVRHIVIDDHLSLNGGGVPAVNIIDFDYAYWHTEFDTPDKCSGESLANVGRILAEIVYNPSLWPNK